MTNQPSKVILHCAATPDESSKDFDIKDVREWHLARGFSDVGYHYVIKRDGTIQSGRSPDQVGAHAEGHNQNSLGICYIGTRRPTVKQIEAILSLYDLFLKTHQISYDAWWGHYEFNPGKECPGFSMDLVRYLLKIHQENQLER